MEDEEHVPVNVEESWRSIMEELRSGMKTSNFKQHELPLARIKKIMKSDEDVSMISAEAPVLFAKACELFILDLTLRAWTHTNENKRRTLQRSDVAMAVSGYEMFDFLIDIVPREEIIHHKMAEELQHQVPAPAMPMQPMGYMGHMPDHTAFNPNMQWSSHAPAPPHDAEYPDQDTAEQ